MARKKGNKYDQGQFHPRRVEKYKGKLPIIYRSSWEKKFCSFCDNTPQVIAWGSESVVIRYNDPSRKNTSHRYFIDFNMTVKTKDGSLQKFIVEVKPFKETQKPVLSARRKPATMKRELETYIRNQAKWKAATEWAKQKGGTKFIVITEKDLFQQK
jgi:hypothetical protein